ncbi:response regulator [Zeaxanthinibacter sp. PT1]|uniref:response regulator n=1 Tax=Zeaxanthinibacter TaxID=561554 RepID=UPI0023494D44|nr:response regulator [Zeaxanthinibacter sp. PT1]MDC6351019.1 response regulator [Zeaxanthinibacter sp. PT1]
MKKIRTSCIIDDDPIFIYGTKRIMKEVNFCDEILVYQNGQQALDGLSSIVESDENFPSVIFLDLNMPIMNGWEFLDQLITINHPKKDNLIIYIISSSIDPRDLERVKDYEIVHNYILKPVTPKDLSTVMEVLHDY